MTYKNLYHECLAEGLEVHEVDMKLKGAYSDGFILINKSLCPEEKRCILAEELGHHHTTTGDILDLTIPENLKQEMIARAWAYRRIAPIDMLIKSYLNCCYNCVNVSGCARCDCEGIQRYLGVTKKFLMECLRYYGETMGNCYKISDNYYLTFSPLCIFRSLGDFNMEELTYGTNKKEQKLVGHTI